MADTVPSTAKPSPNGTAAPTPTAPTPTAPTPTAPTPTAPTPTAPTPTAVVTDFLAALGRLDVEAALALLAEDVMYQNVSLPAARGRDAVARQLRLLTRHATGFEAINHRIAADGHVVLTERTDIIELRGFRAEFWVCGSFEVRDGRITQWRDYFDWANVLAALAKGGVRALLSLGRRG